MLILIVDDDPDVRAAVADVLALEGYGVLTAAHGGEALALLQGGAAPDVILLDLMMPVMDGKEFIQSFRELSGARDIPVVLVTAHRDGKRIASELGTAAYIMKPLGADVLIAKVVELASR